MMGDGGVSITCEFIGNRGKEWVLCENLLEREGESGHKVKVYLKERGSGHQVKVYWKERGRVDIR